jgi:hypothetical protein
LGDSKLVSWFKFVADPRSRLISKQAHTRSSSYEYNIYTHSSSPPSMCQCPPIPETGAPRTEETPPRASTYSLISFNVCTLMVDELIVLVLPSGPVIGILIAPSLLVPPRTGTSLVSMMEQGALGRQNGLWAFQSW